MKSDRIGLFKRHQSVNAWAIIQIPILPTYQGQGITARLLNTFLQQADETSVPVTLSILKGNRAIILYQRLGFKVIDSGDGAVKMKRRRKNHL